MDKHELRMLAADERKSISKAIMETFRSSPLFEPIAEWLDKRNIYFDQLPANGEYISIYTEYGAYNLSTDITGTQTNGYQFRLVYQAFADSDSLRISAKENLDNLAAWAAELNEDEFPIVDDQRQIMKMNFIQTATALSQDNRYIVYHLYMSAIYEKEK